MNCTNVNIGNKQPIILLFHIWKSNLRPSLQLPSGLGNDGFVRFDKASQLNTLGLHNLRFICGNFILPNRIIANHINSSTV